jgi:hypothetical protein
MNFSYPWEACQTSVNFQSPLKLSLLLSTFSLVNILQDEMRKEKQTGVTRTVNIFYCITEQYVFKRIIMSTAGGSIPWKTTATSSKRGN